MNADPSELLGVLEGGSLTIYRENLGESSGRQVHRPMQIRVFNPDRVLELSVMNTLSIRFRPLGPLDFQAEKEFYGVFSGGYNWRFVASGETSDIENIFRELSLIRWINLLPLYTSGYSHDNAPASHPLSSSPDWNSIPLQDRLNGVLNEPDILRHTGEASYIEDQAGRYHTGFISFKADKQHRIFLEFAREIENLGDRSINIASFGQDEDEYHSLRIMVPDEIIQRGDVSEYQYFMEAKWRKVLGAIKRVVRRNFRELVVEKFDSNTIQRYRHSPSVLVNFSPLGNLAPESFADLRISA